MAITIGSEKQIAWAQKIQADAIKACDDLQKATGKSAEKIPGALKIWFLSIEDAKFFIEMRGHVDDARLLHRHFVLEDGSMFTRMATGARIPPFSLPIEITSLDRE